MARQLSTWTCMVEPCRRVLRFRRTWLPRRVLVWASSSLPHHFLYELHVGFRTYIGCAEIFGPSMSEYSVEDKTPMANTAYTC